MSDLTNLTLKGALDVTAHAFSASARAAIEATGGKVTIIERKEKQA